MNSNSLNNLDKLDDVSQIFMRHVANTIKNSLVPRQYKISFLCPKDKGLKHSYVTVLKALNENKYLRKWQIVGKNLVTCKVTCRYDVKHDAWINKPYTWKADANRGRACSTFTRLRAAGLIANDRKHGYYLTEEGKIYVNEILPQLITH